MNLRKLPFKQQDISSTGLYGEVPHHLDVDQVGVKCSTRERKPEADAVLCAFYPDLRGC
jgi:hypothetical protein